MANDRASFETEEFMQAIGSVIDDGFCLCEIIRDGEGRPVDYRFLQTNRHFEAMTGLPDARGRTALELVPDLESHWIEIYGQVVAERVPRRFESESAPMGRTFDVYAAPAEPPGCFTLVFRDVTPLKRAEAEREAALVEARQLLEELNHRVMNSLGVIASIISMEARSRKDGDGRRALKRVEARLQAVATLYGELTRSSSIDSVDAAPYLDRVLAALSASIGGEGFVELTADIAPVRLSTQKAVPLGLIVNELVTNSYKYAFPSGAGGGTVSVTLRHRDGTHELRVSDDGRGMGKAPASVTGLGQRLVEAFVQQIGGEREVTTGPGGTSVTIRFPAD